MARKVYASGVMASDFDEPKTGGNMAQLNQPVFGPVLSDHTRAKAAENVRWLCPDDTDEMLDALGLAEPSDEPDPRCPTCGSPPGESCKSAKGRKVSRHIARTRLAGRIDNTEGITE